MPQRALNEDDPPGRSATASSDASCPTAPPTATPRRSSSAWWHVHTASLPHTSLTRRASRPWRLGTRCCHSLPTGLPHHGDPGHRWVER